MAGKSKSLWTAIGIVAFGVVAAIAWRGRSQGQERTGGPAGPERRSVSVLVAAVEKRAVPIYLEGLGTVTAFKTVTVRSQVEGRLDRVAFREGQDVKRGALLAQVDPRPFTIQLHQAQAAHARDDAQLGAARRNLDRYVAVSKDKLIAQQQVDDQRALVAQLEATAASNKTQIEQARLLLDYAAIKSPIDGVTGVRLVDPGNIVRPTDAGGIVVVTQLDPIAVLFTLPQDDLPRVSRAMAGGTKLRVEARTRDGGDVLAAGELALVDNQINVTTATLRLKAILPNPDRSLWPNQFVKVRLLVETRQGALVIPAAAVQRGPSGPFVYVVGADGMVQSRPVEVDAIIGADAIVKDGPAALTVGQQVVTDGQSQLRPGAKVDVRQPTRKGAPP